MTDVMRSRSITVRMTPRQAVVALRALEMSGLTTSDERAFTARHRVMVGMWESGWEFDEDREVWRLDGRKILDRAG